MSDAYSSAIADESRVAEVGAGKGRNFLVVNFRIRGQWKTFVFQDIAPGRTSALISRREIDGNLDPISAVTGLLLGAAPLPHPIEEVQRQLELCRRANWILRDKLARSERVSAGRKKRGKQRGRRNS